MGTTAAIPRRDARIIGLVGSGHFLSHFYTLSLPPLFPILKDEFDVSSAALRGVMTAYAVASGCAQLPVGFTATRDGTN